MTRYVVVPYRESKSQNSLKSSGHSVADKTEYVQQILALLDSKDFRERIKGIDQLAADCQTNTSMVLYSLFPVSQSVRPSVRQSAGHRLLLDSVLFTVSPPCSCSRCLTPSKRACRSPTAR